MARYPKGIGVCLLTAACSAGPTGGGTVANGSNPGAVSNMSPTGPAHIPCSTDGSDRITIGTYSHDWNTVSNAFAVDVIMPDCTFCEDVYHVDIPTAPTELRRMPETWSS